MASGEVVIVTENYHSVGKVLFRPRHVVGADDEDQLMAGDGKSQHHEADSPPEILHVSDGVLVVVDHVGASYVYPDVDGVRRQTA